MREDLVYGVDVGASSIKGAIIGKIGKEYILKSKIIETPTNSENARQTLYDILEELKKNDNGNKNKRKFAGIGLPGIIDKEKGVVNSAVNIPSFKKFSIVDELKKIGITAYIENDVLCAAIGIKKFGEAKSLDDFAVISIGTGINAAFYKNGNWIRSELGQSPYGSKTFEYYCSGKGFREVYGMSIEDAAKSFKKMVEAENALYEFGSDLAHFIYTAALSVDTKNIILTGSVVKARKAFEETMNAALKEMARDKLEEYNIIFSKMEYPGVIGAAAMCFERMNGKGK